MKTQYVFGNQLKKQSNIYITGKYGTIITSVQTKVALNKS